MNHESILQMLIYIAFDMQELVEDYCRGSRSAKIFCVKDVARCGGRDACVYLSSNDWDVEAALQSFYHAPKKTQEARKQGKRAKDHQQAVVSWSSGGAKPWP